MLRVGPLDDPDRYELVQVGPRGGEGEVWRATLTLDGVALPVAVKVILDRNSADIAEWRQRWQRQAELLRSLDHPGLVKVREVFEGTLPHEPGAEVTTSRSLFLVMNWAEGVTLSEWVAQNPNRDLLDSLRIISRVASAVDYLHSGRGVAVPVLHRDIKPANIIVNNDEIRLVDFGFTRMLTSEPMTLAGTPAFMPPEILQGAPYTEASDRFGVGATAYYAITGEPPNMADYAGMHRKLSNAKGAGGRADLADHILVMLNPDPTRRPTSCTDWAQTLTSSAVSGQLTTVARTAANPVTPPPPTRMQPIVSPTEQHDAYASQVYADSSNGSRTGWIAAAIVLVVLLIGGVAYAATRGDSSKGANPIVDTSTTTTFETTTTEEPTTTTEEVTTTVFSSNNSTETTSPLNSPDLKAAYLDSFDQVEGDGFIQQAKMNGTTYPHAVQIVADYSDTRSVSYDLSRSWKSLNVKVGARDDDPDGADALFAIYGDGVKLQSGELRLGVTIPVTISVSGVLRLKLEVTSTSHLGDQYWVFGDAQVTR